MSNLIGPDDESPTVRLRPPFPPLGEALDHPHRRPCRRRVEDLPRQRQNNHDPRRFSSHRAANTAARLLSCAGRRGGKGCVRLPFNGWRGKSPRWSQESRRQSAIVGELGECGRGRQTSGPRRVRDTAEEAGARVTQTGWTADVRDPHRSDGVAKSARVRADYPVPHVGAAPLSWAARTGIWSLGRKWG
jgi:hypothetical protein